MAFFNQTINVAVQEGNDSISRTSYISGDFKIATSIPIPGSGSLIFSGVTIDLAKHQSFSVGNNLPSGMLNVGMNSLSGTVTFNTLASQSNSWWINNGIFADPLAIASGNIVSVTLQRASGYDITSSGSYRFDLQSISDL